MAEHTPAQLAQFAEMIGITPETHRHLTMQYWEPDFPEGGIVGEVMRLPALDTPAGDDVFLAPFLRWLSAEDYQPKISGGTVWFEATVEGPDSWQSVEEKHMALALLRACQSARVPEICKIFSPEHIDR